MRMEKNVNMLYVMLTDILEEASKVICEGHDAEKLLAEAFHVAEAEHEDGVYLEGVISRKKQMIPTLMNAMTEKA